MNPVAIDAVGRLELVHTGVCMQSVIPQTALLLVAGDAALGGPAVGMGPGREAPVAIRAGVFGVRPGLDQRERDLHPPSRIEGRCVLAEELEFAVAEVAGWLTLLGRRRCGERQTQDQRNPHAQASNEGAGCAEEKKRGFVSVHIGEVGARPPGSLWNCASRATSRKSGNLPYGLSCVLPAQGCARHVARLPTCPFWPNGRPERMFAA